MLISRGRELDRLLVAFDAIRAYADGRDEVLEAQEKIYSESFLLYGLLSLAVGMLFLSPDPQIDLDKVRAVFPEEEHQDRISIIRVLTMLQEDESFAFPISPEPMDPAHHQEMTSVLLAVAGLAAEHHEESLESFLDRVQLGVIEAHVESE